MHAYIDVYVLMYTCTWADKDGLMMDMYVHKYIYFIVSW